MQRLMAAVTDRDAPTLKELFEELSLPPMPLGETRGRRLAAAHGKKHLEIGSKCFDGSLRQQMTAREAHARILAAPSALRQLSAPPPRPSSCKERASRQAALRAQGQQSLAGPAVAEP